MEEATAQVLLQLQERAAAEQGVQVANAKIGAALRRLLEDEGVAAEGVGSLVDLTVRDVRRLARAAPSGAASPAEASVVADEGQDRPGLSGHLAAVPPLEGEQHRSVSLGAADPSVQAIAHWLCSATGRATPYRRPAPAVRCGRPHRARPRAGLGALARSGLLDFLELAAKA